MSTLPAPPLAHPTQLQRNAEDQLGALIDAIGWPLVLHALAQNALTCAVSAARDNAHAARVLMNVSTVLATLERHTDRERV
jgi:hypothetical protein